jgi:hypothetical protein
LRSWKEFLIVITECGDYLIGVRRFLAVVIAVGMASSAASAFGRGLLVKVLPEYLDLKGRNSLSPSLYERDAYQVVLRTHPERRSGMRFYVQWKNKGPMWEPLLARVELRGIAEGKVPRQFVLENAVSNPGGIASHWTELTLQGEAYKKFGAITAWRVTLWSGQTLVGQEQSFLW